MDACYNGHGSLCKKFLELEGSLRVDVHENKEQAFIQACYKSNDEDTIALLLSLDGDRRVDVHARKNQAFVGACTGGKDVAVRMLLQLCDERRIDVHHDEDWPFKSACKNKRHKVVQMLLTAGRDRLPPKAVYDKYCTRPEPYERWLYGKENNPRGSRLI
jgi:hypothetical protein